MKTQRMIMVSAALWLGVQLLTFGEYIEIGAGTYTTTLVPVYGYCDYGWSQAIYAEGELGGPMLIHGISYNVANTPVDYVMSDQRIYLKQTAVSKFSNGAYDDPDAAGFTKVFEGPVTWNGAGWQTIALDTPFLYTGTGSLIVYWQNHDGDWDSGYPTFRYTSVSYTAKYQQKNGSFPVSAGGSWGSSRADIRFHYSNWQPTPSDGEAAVQPDALPTLAWNNPEGTLSNAVYFSASAASVSEMNPGTCVQPAGTYPYTVYTNATPLAAGTTYYWCVRAFLEDSQMVGGPFSFTTEPTAQASYPWIVDFENGGAMPPFWYQEKIAGNAVWSAQAAGLNNAPNAPWNGSYLAAFGGAGGGATTRLIAPVLDLDGAATPLLTFMHAQPALGGACDTLKVYWRNASTNDWQLLPGGAFTTAVSDWTRQTLALPSPSETYYIAFEGMNIGGGGVALDDLFVLEESGSLTLEVFDSYGDPLADAAMAVFAPGSDHVYEKAQSDADGHATFYGLPTGVVRYRSDEGFHNVVDETLTLGAGHVTHRVDLDAAIPLSGVIRANDENSNRIEGVTVSLLNPPPGSEVVACDQTDAFGQYRFSRVTEGDYLIQATVAPSMVEGVLYGADEVTDEGVTIYKPVSNKEVSFVLHESVRAMYNLEQFAYTTMTDSNGCYSLQVPPGIYGIEIPAMPGYWGCKVESTSLIGWSGQDGGWPYAYTNEWNADANNSSIYRGEGIGLGSDHQTKLDLFVNRDRYVVQTQVSQYSPMTRRLIYIAPDVSEQAWREVIDPIESGTTLSLSNGAIAPIRQYSGGLRAVWTNLTGGTLTLSGDSHPYLSCTTTVSRTTFAWGEYPGQPPATEPPHYGTVLNETPLPMIVHSMQNCRLDPDHTPTNVRRWSMFSRLRTAMLKAMRRLC